MSCSEACFSMMSMNFIVMLLESTLPNATFAAAVSGFRNRGSKFGEAFTLFRFLRCACTRL